MMRLRMKGKRGQIYFLELIIQLKIERGFGFVSISPEKDSPAITANASSFEHLSSPLGYSLDTANKRYQSLILTENNLMDQKKANRELFSDELNKLNNICISQQYIRGYLMKPTLNSDVNDAYISI